MSKTKEQEVLTQEEINGLMAVLAACEEESGLSHQDSVHVEPATPTAAEKTSPFTLLTEEEKRQAHFARAMPTEDDDTVPPTPSTPEEGVQPNPFAASSSAGGILGPCATLTSQEAAATTSSDGEPGLLGREDSIFVGHTDGDGI